ncbi:hypothetical protein T05_13621 [Trichinella murrelli]|uniref:Uncharacterized protein n=1 Tax=Trichinella murrelli TaxID=144512 RepID=A0A0V0SYN0_9BILA|nr:hypothetical protein T05_13621 [Trichinella murrelli]
MPRRQKLDRDWEGPYLTVEVMEPQTYRVRHQEQKRKSKSKRKSEQKLTGGTFCTDEAVRRQRVCLRPDEGCKADTKTMLMKCNDEMVLMKVRIWHCSRCQMSQSILTRLYTIAIASQICIEVPRKDDQMSRVLVSMCVLSKILSMY